MDILSTSEKIKDHAAKVEKYIIDHEPTPMSLEGYINYTMQHIQSTLPKSVYHYRFLYNLNNINKTDFIRLIQEQYYAFSYLYVSINHILRVKNTFGHAIDELLEKISNHLKKRILCNYRNIFYVYSQSWSPIDKINGIETVKILKRNSPSLSHHAYSIIAIRLLQQWIEHITSIILNIDSE